MLTDTLFSVKEVPAVFSNEQSPTYKWNTDTGYKFIIREDTNKVLSCMTDEYKVVTNKELIDTAVPLLKSHKAELVESVTFGDGARSVWKWRIPGVEIKIADGDLLNPEVILKNSYDGTLQVHVLAGAFRLVCSNGLVIGVTLGQTNFKHNINNKNLENLEEAIETTIEHSLAVGDKFELLSDTQLNEKHIIKLVEMFPFQMSEFLVQYLIAQSPKNYWDLLNCATYLATHKMKRQYQSTHSLEKKIFPSVTKWAKAVSAEA
jgi:hypothetical protein